MKTVLVGEAPARTTVGAPPFSGASGRRLRELSGLPKLRDGFDTFNLFDRWPGPAAKGSTFDARLAREAARDLHPRLRERRVVLVGRRVAEAFRLGQMPYLRWERDVGGFAEVAVLPHPSGVVRWWNESANVEAARRFLREAAGR